MRKMVLAAGLLGIGISMAVAYAATTNEGSEIDRALSNNRHVADEAIAEIRARGPAGLQMLLEQRDQASVRMKPSKRSTETLRELDAVIDAVGAQRDCAVSRLYWHTDIEKAKAAAIESGKPILSLRLLGKLTDEFSCANSRFFRTTLYSNRDVSALLRERFVLHWKTVRPVPKVTIDFGDGRKLERTLTGNSIHYVLDSQGQVVDALPGLYGPAAFMLRLKSAERVAVEVEASRGRVIGFSESEVLHNYHQQRLEEIARNWEADLKNIELHRFFREARKEQEKTAAVNLNDQVQAPAPKRKVFPTAEKAVKIAAPKRLGEVAIIPHVTMSVQELNDKTTDALWREIAALHIEEAKLDEASIKLMRSEIGIEERTAEAAGELSVSKGRFEDPLLRVIGRFQTSIALDTVRNEYLLHRRIHEWFVNHRATRDAEQLNERVYAELFLTPSSDPWLGLLPAATYTALENGGVIVDESAISKRSAP